PGQRRTNQHRQRDRQRADRVHRLLRVGPTSVIVGSAVRTGARARPRTSPLRELDGAPDHQYASAETTSLPVLVESERQTEMLTEFWKNLTLPWDRRALAPPGW